jgi:hypothetical protein
MCPVRLLFIYIFSLIALIGGIFVLRARGNVSQQTQIVSSWSNWTGLIMDLSSFKKLFPKIGTLAGVIIALIIGCFHIYILKNSLFDWINVDS